MRNTDHFKDKKIAVVGLARSGLACANLLYEVGAQVWVSDHQDTEATRALAGQLRSKDIRVELGRHTPECIKGKDVVVVSPGVTKASPAVAWALEEKIPVISEIEVGWELCPAVCIAVTGSSGKSTVTTLIGDCLASSGKKSFVLGNIGNPFCAEVDKVREGDFVSLEVSSFQLERIKAFKPKIAVMLNFNRNHLDRHKDMGEYLDAKKRIFMNQDKNEYLVLNRQDAVLCGLADQAKARVIFFNGSKEYNPNQAAVVAVASILGISDAVCKKVFSEFKGLAHRLEYVTTIQGVTFINDSKATLAESTVWAIQSIPGKIILIAGGKDKGVEYGGIVQAAAHKVKEVIVIGEAKDKIRQALNGFLPLTQAQSLKEAVASAFRKAAPGDYVLLSPMCSSFDMFLDYEERGRAFKEAVTALARTAV